MCTDKSIRWPGGKKFAFTIVDDTDNATLENIQDIYNTLTELQLFITKTVWPLSIDKNTEYGSSHTLQDDSYLQFISGLQNSGHEIALHGVRGCSSERQTIIEGLKFFQNVMGSLPKLHVNHAQNLDNLYWGKAWIPKWKRIIKRYPNEKSGYGHDPKSNYFWGDIAKECIEYVRGYVFNHGNTTYIDRYTPYHDPGKQYVQNWFSSSNGDRLDKLLNLTSSKNLDELERTNGACIVYTHFGDSYYKINNKIEKSLKLNLQNVSQREGWFVPASTLLDFLKNNRTRNLTTLQSVELNIKHSIDINK